MIAGKRWSRIETGAELRVEKLKIEK